MAEPSLQHIDLLRQTDPDLLALIGEQPLPPVQQPLAPSATGESIPIQGQQGQQDQNIPNRILERSPMSDMMGEQGLPPQISGPGVENANLPNMPRPPAPFQNAPVSPQELTPQ